MGNTTRGSRAAHWQPPQTRLGPWPPRSPGPLGHPPRPSPSLVGLSHLFRTFFFGPQGGHLRPRAKTVISDAQGGSRGVWGRKGAVQGSQMDPVNAPIAGLVKGGTFIRTSLLSCGAVDPQKGGCCCCCCCRCCRCRCCCCRCCCCRCCCCRCCRCRCRCRCCCRRCCCLWLMAYINGMAYGIYGICRGTVYCVWHDLAYGIYISWHGLWPASWHRVPVLMSHLAVVPVLMCQCSIYTWHC